MARIKRSIRERFEEKIDRTPGHGPNGDCWVWTASKSHFGYGKLGIDTECKPQKIGASHRLAYEFYIGPITEGMHVLHRCDNPPCVNPEHLFLGTNIDNIRDRQCKGRKGNVYKSFGELNYNSVANESQVREILRLWKQGGLKKSEIAKIFGLTYSIVAGIVMRRSWRHIED